ncbi:MAG: DUF6492 family protein [Pontiella sp.]
MDTVVLCCKSYRNDLKRLVRLAVSIERFNVDRLPFYVIVPTSDRAMFAEALGSLPHILIEDPDILSLNPAAEKIRSMKLDGGIMQQVVKSQFWRLGVAENEVVIDSDSYFIRGFKQSDFMADATTPFTVMHEGKDLLQWAARSGQNKISGYFEKDRRMTMDQFGRTGRVYDFGPTPCIWSSSVWKQLDEEYAHPRGKNFADLIVECPNEMIWYGEALLHFKTFPVFPREPLFKVFHYKEQFEEAIGMGESEAVWAKNFMGMVMQSAWEYDLDVICRKQRSWKTLWLFKI